MFGLNYAQRLNEAFRSLLETKCFCVSEWPNTILSCRKNFDLRRRSTKNKIMIPVNLKTEVFIQLNFVFCDPIKNRIFVPIICLND